MTKLPRPSGKELVAALGKIGFEVIRIRGSSAQRCDCGMMPSHEHPLLP
jgi:hypothetical protein